MRVSLKLYEVIEGDHFATDLEEGDYLVFHAESGTMSVRRKDKLMLWSYGGDLKERIEVNMTQKADAVEFTHLVSCMAAACGLDAEQQNRLSSTYLLIKDDKQY